MDAASELSSQWKNPGDILSLLLLIGGDIVQKAIAQLFGVYVQPTTRWPRIYLTPVAFSFGWVGYAFTSITSVSGDKQLMPSADGHSIIINCSSGYGRVNRSWLLDRILRDHELEVETRPGPEAAKLNDSELKKNAGLNEHKPLRISLRIDIFNLNDEPATPSIDHVWVFGWLTIAAQLGISIAPWVLYDDWAIFLITASGTLFALLTGSLRQWSLEKWPGRRLNESRSATAGTHEAGTKSAALSTAAAAVPSSISANASDIELGQAAGPYSRANNISATTEAPNLKPESDSPKEPKLKVVCLTRGNGHRHAMVLVGTGTAWDLETLATATSDSLPETPWCLLALAVAWVCLLISVSGLKAHSWFLILIGGLGMLQNVYASAAPRDPACVGLAIARREGSGSSTIIGASVPEWPKDSELPPDAGDPAPLPNNDPLLTHVLGPLQTIGVRGAIRELEKRFPGAGFALMLEFFPALVRVEPERYRHRRERQFWEWMFVHRKSGERPELVFE